MTVPSAALPLLPPLPEEGSLIFRAIAPRLAEVRVAAGQQLDLRSYCLVNASDRELAAVTITVTKRDKCYAFVVTGLVSKKTFMYDGPRRRQILTASESLVLNRPNLFKISQSRRGAISIVNLTTLCQRRTGEEKRTRVGNLSSTTQILSQGRDWFCLS